MALLKITYVLPNVESGGTERHVLSLAGRIDRSRFSLSMVTTAGGGSLYDDFSSMMPVTVLGEPKSSRRFRKGPLEHLRTIQVVARLLRRSTPDILHAYLPAANVIGPLAARLSGVPRVIVSKRALAEYKAHYPLLRRVEPLGNRLADVILVNSDAVRRDVERTERHWAGKFRKIYNGVAPIDRGRRKRRRHSDGGRGSPSTRASCSAYPTSTRTRGTRNWWRPPPESCRRSGTSSS